MPMRILSISIALLFVLTVSACGDDNSDNVNDDANVTTDQTIGSSCYCDGDGCTAMGGVEIPYADTIVGCDDTPEETAENGYKRVCLRSYTGSLATDTWFANGYCAVQSATCDGDDTICNSATFGDYAAMTECPENTVLLQYPTTVEVGAWSAEISNKICVAACASNDDCRTDETDPVFNEEIGQYTCVDEKDPVKFCFDPRNLPDVADYTAEVF